VDDERIYRVMLGEKVNLLIGISTHIYHMLVINVG
jgi:hypothetical protein